ncbi:MAG: LytTR family DNA-binding domain-containing protein, partial [Bacteroidota bacterium]
EETIRATLSGLEQQLRASTILRCHRSYLVNPNHIRQARGNAQGLRLSLVALEEEVPVSRAYVSQLRALMIG